MPQSNSNEYTGDPLDQFLGKKLKEFRQKVNWTLSDLASRVKLSHQQIHKYEQAQSKISATMLYQLARLFNTTPNSFFEGFVPPAHATIDQKDLITTHKKELIHLLLIEDNPADEYLVRRALANSQYEFNIYLMSSGKDVLHFLRNRDLHPFAKPDIILLDLHLPEMSGHDVLRAFKQDRDMQEIPVIIMTNSLNKLDLSKAYKNHASGYIAKSFEYDKFETSLLQTLDYWVNAVILPTVD